MKGAREADVAKQEVRDKGALPASGAFSAGAATSDSGRCGGGNMVSPRGLMWQMSWKFALKTHQETAAKLAKEKTADGSSLRGAVRIQDSYSPRLENRTNHLLFE